MRKRPKRYATAWVTWSPAIEQLLAPFQRVMIADLTAPERVRVYDGERHTTVVAKFQHPDSDTVTTVKLRREK